MINHNEPTLKSITGQKLNILTTLDFVLLPMWCSLLFVCVRERVHTHKLGRASPGMCSTAVSLHTELNKEDREEREDSVERNRGAAWGNNSVKEEVDILQLLYLHPRISSSQSSK